MSIAWADVAAAYPEGYTWQRNSAYRAGRTHDSTRGNPNIDGEGAGVYHYYAVTAPSDAGRDPSLGAPPAERWYRLARRTLPWDNNQDRWAHRLATVGRREMIHSALAQGNEHQFVPMYVWKNPAGDGVYVRIDGAYTIRWTHDYDIEIVVAYHDVSEDRWVELSPTARYARPDGSSALDLRADPVLQRFDAGDELVVSVRARESVEAAAALAILEDQITLTRVPQPRALPTKTLIKPRASDANDSTASNATTPATTGTSSNAPAQWSSGTITIVLVTVAVIINGALVVLLWRWWRNRTGAV